MRNPGGGGGGGGKYLGQLLGYMPLRLLAVPFKIVAKAREKAEQQRKTGANERRVHGESLFLCFSPCSSRAVIVSRKNATPSRGTSPLASYKEVSPPLRVRKRHVGAPLHCKTVVFFANRL